ncbi:MAG: MFS transporter [Clostridia bacterium]|nr:MFS transporter [Clostridia bacterium]
MTMTAKHNIKVYYWYLGLFQLLVGPIITLYLLYKGLSFTEIMTLQSIFAISVFLLEVPTGAVGDLFGRKKSLVLACLAMIAGLFVYIIGQQFIVFAVGEFLLALGMSLKSGSDTALIYDSLLESGQADEFTKIQGKGNSYMLGVQIIGSVAAGYIYTLNEQFPMILSMIMMAFAAVSALFFKEIEIHKDKVKPDYFTQIKESASFLYHHKRVRSIVIYFMFFALFFRAGFWFYQPYMTALSIDVKYFGLIFAAFNIVATLASRFSHIYIKKTKGKSLILLSLLTGVSFILLGIFRIQAAVVFIFIQQLVRGVNNPVFMKFMNKHIESDKRATVISFSSLLNNLGIALIFPLVGYLMDRINIISLNLFTGILMLTGTVFFYFFLRRKLIRD